MVNYEILYHPDGKEHMEMSVNTSEATSGIIGDLTMNIMYNLVVRAYTSKGPGPFSKQIKFRTEGKQPGPPTNVVIRRDGKNSLIVSFDPPRVGKGLVEKYKIYYSSKYNDDMEKWDSVEFDASETEHRIESIAEKTSYCVRVRALSSHGGFGNFSEVEYYRPYDTVNKIENQVEQLNLRKNDPDFLLTWSKPTSNRPVESYKVTIRSTAKYYDSYGRPKTEENSKDVTLLSSAREHVFQNPRPNTHYQFLVAVRFEGEQNYEPPLSVNTKTTGIPPKHVVIPKPLESKGAPRFQLSRVSTRLGYIKHYTLYVVKANAINNKPPKYIIEYDSNNPSVYATAQFDGDPNSSNRLPNEFKLGDGKKLVNFVSIHLFYPSI